MLTRWYSLRHRETTRQPNISDPQALTRPSDFDFAFPETRATATVRSPTGETVLSPRPVHLRPRTSGAPTAKRKPRTDAPPARPKTSENHKQSKDPRADLESEDPSIGLAFGSPSHPPATFGMPADNDEHDSSPLQRFIRAERSRQMQSKKWKKIGTLFKSRQIALRREEIPSGPTIGLPTGFTVLDKSPTSQSVEFSEHRLRPIGDVGQPYRQRLPPKGKDSGTHKWPLDKSHHTTDTETVSRPSTATDSSLWVEPDSRPPLPKLELDIPTPPLDRYSVMFRNLPAATRSSSLLARRSKTLESLVSLDELRSGVKAPEEDGLTTYYDPATPLVPPQRLGSPTNRSPVASKYSLFPNTSPAASKVQARVTDGNNHQLKRTASSPARLTPMKDRFSVDKPEPLNPKRIEVNEQPVSSPEDNTASTDRSAPWSAAHSFQSSISSVATGEEIFFDIRSFRDSKGVEDGQFVMTRPDSVAVELARTRSKKTAGGSNLREAQSGRPDHETVEEEPLTPIPQPTSLSGMTSATTTKHTSVNTAYFDEAIAAVERLTSPTSASQEKLPPVTFTVPTLHVPPQPENAPAPPSDSSLYSSRPVDHTGIRTLSKAREGVGLMIPSPVPEAKEDLSPKSDVTITNAPAPSLLSSSSVVSSSSKPLEKPQTGQILSPRVIAIKRVDRPIGDSPTIPQGPPSPPRRAPAPKPQPQPQPQSQSQSQPRSATSSPQSDDKPPPVPRKDSKFIPLSKYATKSTVAKIEQAGIIPTRPSRSNTDTLLQGSSSASSSPFIPGRSASPLVRGAKERSATLPTSLQGLEKTIPPSRPPRPNPMAMNPPSSTAPEVAVARTVSLSRKQSARINVTAPRLAARRAEAAAAALQKAKQQSSSSSGSPPSPSSIAATVGSSLERGGSKSGMGILGHHHRHRRSGSKSLSRDRIKIVKREPDAKKVRDAEKQMVKEAKKWELLERKAYSPVVVQAERGHKPGLSVGLVVERI
ncbi:hypothetical protein PV08_00898 [Exophiala spinifera]|uniref:Uncharacterized protein n=1 Tax=Exophiala spinifera TaxID=91928 RepID=A0A0D2BN05_9EURO|nr:uncharacterized protein PV08_00898 [Exophiala spinifera]KIW20323.1 hypothetical protein PV08_00898 [Exophiala spinifera]